MTNKEPLKGSIPPPPPPPGMAPAVPPPLPVGLPALAEPVAPAMKPVAPPVRSNSEAGAFSGSIPLPPPPPGMPPPLAPLALAEPVAPPPALAEPVAPPLAEPLVSSMMAGISPEELQAQLDGLSRRVRAGRRRSLLLAVSAAAAILLGAACWGGYYGSVVLGYVQLDPQIQIRRDPLDENHIAVVCRPKTPGTISFRHANADRDTELLDRVAASEVGQDHELRWRIDSARPGDVIQVTSREGLHLTSTALLVPAIAAARAQTTVLVGQIVNAINNRPVAGAELRIPGTHLSVRSGQDGRYRLEGVPAGKVPVKVSAAGFTSEQFEEVLGAGRENPLRVAISPGMKAGQIRVVLTWGDDPKDLDAHLEGPLPRGGKFHVYYGNQGDLKNKEFVHLDVDAQNGQGPETITVLGVLPGVYHYWVHDYSDRDDPKSTALARSEAEVKVFQGDQTYRFRAGHEMVGNRWDVCSIEVKPQGLAANVQKVDTYQQTKLESLGLYAKRTLAGREQWIAQSGGSEHSEHTVDEGLAWLARHQDRDGSWSNHCLGDGVESRCEKPSNCTGAGSVHCPMAHTGLAVLAFQAGGHYYFNHNVYSETVRRGLDWLVENEEPDGALFDAALESGAKLRSPFAAMGKSKAAKARARAAIAASPTGRNFTNASMYEQGMAAFALADACATVRDSGQEPDHRYLEATARAIRFIEQVQHNDGGWRYNDQPNAPSDTSVTGWQVLALKSAREAGIPLPQGCVEAVRHYFEVRKRNVDGRTWYINGHETTEAVTGVGMLARQFLLDAPNDPLIPAAAQYLAGEAARRWGDRSGSSGENDYYLWYNCTLGMYQAGGPPWEQWNPIIRDTIIKLQRHDGCARGSWDPNFRWGPQGGRILSTALAALTLETYYRYTAPQERGEAASGSLQTGPITSTPGGAVPARSAAPAEKPVAPGEVGGLEARVKPIPPPVEQRRDK